MLALDFSLTEQEEEKEEEARILGVGMFYHLSRVSLCKFSPQKAKVHVMMGVELS